MRLVLFFDLPVETAANRRDYRKFVKEIKKIGFYMLQESVYVKLGVDSRAADSAIEKVKKSLPHEGNISVLTITEKQFSDIKVLLGDMKKDVVDSDERIIEL